MKINWANQVKQELDKTEYSGKIGKMEEIGEPGRLAQMGPLVKISKFHELDRMR